MLFTAVVYFYNFYNFISYIDLHKYLSDKKNKVIAKTTTSSTEFDFDNSLLTQKPNAHSSSTIVTLEKGVKYV